jgi:hypothetical protein
MNKSKGVIMFAHNNQEIDYVLQAIISAKFVKKNLKVPVSLITDTGTKEWLEKNYDSKIFDQIILTDNLLKIPNNLKRYYDGSITYKNTEFKNGYRTLAFQLSPYEKTLVIDTDLLIVNDKLKHIWDTDVDFMINKKHYDLASDRDIFEFQRVNDHGIDFYWATAFYFKKTEWAKVFFNLCQHIIQNYDFYRFIYRINYPILRNDYVFSIAIHIMAGFTNKNHPMSLPCNIHYTLDRDELYQINSSTDFVFLVQKKDCLGEYTLVKTSENNIHIMNKYSIGRHADKLLEVANV